jgi:hypothetical protein
LRLPRPRSDPGAETTRLRNILARVLRHDALLSKIVMCLLSPANVTNKDSWGRTPQKKRGAEPVGTWEDESENLPAAARLVLARPAGDESGRPSSASLCPDEGLPPHEKRILGLFKADQATHIDEIVEQLETEMSPWEIFAALFELKLAGKVRQMPRKNLVKTFEKQRVASSYRLPAQPGGDPWKTSRICEDSSIRTSPVSGMCVLVRIQAMSVHEPWSILVCGVRF